MTNFLTFFVENYNNIVSIILMMLGFYIVIVSTNLVKKLIGVAIFQTSVLLIYISAAYVQGARFPILKEGTEQYINPLPHVLMLTAIVVGIATLAVGLALVVRIKESFGTIDEDEIIASEIKATQGSISEDKAKEEELNKPNHRKKKIVAIQYRDNTKEGKSAPQKRLLKRKTTTAKKTTKKAASKKSSTKKDKGEA